MSDSQGPHDNPPGWTDPYADLSDLSGDEPLPQLESPSTPPATPPGSPLLTGLIIGLLLVALSVAVFQLLRDDDETGDAADTSTSTTAAAEDGATTTTAPEGETSTTTTTSAVATPPSEPYPPLEPAIPVEKLKLITEGIRINSNELKDLVWGTPAAEAIGRFTESFGEPSEDTGWQVSTGQWGICAGDLERIIRYGPFAAILTLPNSEDVFTGYRQDVAFGGLDSPATDLETLSGLKAGDSVGTLLETYASQEVTFAADPQLETVFELRSSNSSDLLLWGPVQGEAEEDLVLGIYAPDECATSAHARP